MIIAIYGLDNDGTQKILNFIEYLKTEYLEDETENIDVEVYPRPFGELFDTYIKGLSLTTMIDRIRIEHLLGFDSHIEIFSKQFINVEIR